MHEVSSILQNKLLTKKCAILDEVGAFKTKSNRWVIRNVILKATWNSSSLLRAFLSSLNRLQLLPCVA